MVSSGEIGGDGLAGRVDAGGPADLFPFWRTPVFKTDLRQVPACSLPPTGDDCRRDPGHRSGPPHLLRAGHCLLVLAHVARESSPGAFQFTEPPTDAERHLGAVLGQAFHQGCSLTGIALATGIPADRVVAIGKRTIRRSKWLSRIAADQV